MPHPRYPEIESAGGITFALDIAFASIGSALNMSNIQDSGFFPGAHARIEQGNKFSQVSLAAEEKLYLTDFWRDGVCLGHGKTANIEQLARCLDGWLTTSVTTAQLAEQFSFVRPYPNAAFYNDGQEVVYQWKSILHDPGRQGIRSFVELAIQDPTLSKLFPYTSLWTLCFSRCTGYPFTKDTPTVTPIVGNQQYLVRASDGMELGAGSASEALKMVLEHLPKDIGPAVRGTSEDL